MFSGDLQNEVVGEKDFVYTYRYGKDVGGMTYQVSGWVGGCLGQWWMGGWGGGRWGVRRGGS